MYIMLVTLDTSHLERSPLKDDVEWNMPRMVVTLDTSHLEMSPLNLSAPRTASGLNNSFISVTAETSHAPIGPCGPLEQSLDSCRHSAMAAWSSALDFVAQPMVRYCDRGHTVAVRVRVTIMITVRFRVSFRVQSG